jgi:hypothetical protein
MKKLQQTPAPVNQNPENVKPALTLVTNEQAGTENSAEPKGDQPGAEAKSEQPPFSEQNKPLQIVKMDAPISIEKRLQAVEALYQKKETLDRYRAKYQEHLQFEIDLSEGTDIETESFATCSLKFTDSRGRSLTVKSGAYLRECHEICKAKYKAIIEQLEEEIRWPYSVAA